MGNSWGHKVRPLTGEEIKQVWIGKKCKISSKCKNDSTYMLTYNYITGRAGRSSSSEKRICKQHAEKYINKEMEVSNERI